MILCFIIHWVETLRLLLSVESVSQFEAFVGIARCHSHIAFHVDSYYKGEL